MADPLRDGVVMFIRSRSVISRHCLLQSFALAAVFMLGGCASSGLENASLNPTSSGTITAASPAATNPPDDHAAAPLAADSDGAQLTPALAAQTSSDDTSAFAEPSAEPGGFEQTGMASYYAKAFHGRRTASGERYDMHAFTAAHRTLPLGACVRVTTLGNAHSVVVRINDRGPFVRGRVIDLSNAAALALGMRSAGAAQVKLERLTVSGGARGARSC